MREGKRKWAWSYTILAALYGWYAWREWASIPLPAPPITRAGNKYHCACGKVHDTPAKWLACRHDGEGDHHCPVCGKATRQMEG